MEVEPVLFPLSCAEQMLATRRRPVPLLVTPTRRRSYKINSPAACWYLRPGGVRLPRILLIQTGLESRADSPTVMRRIWPPPSSTLPLISNAPPDDIWVEGAMEGNKLDVELSHGGGQRTARCASEWLVTRHSGTSRAHAGTLAISGCLNLEASCVHDRCCVSLPRSFLDLSLGGSSPGLHIPISLNKQADPIVHHVCRLPKEGAQCLLLVLRHLRPHTPGHYCCRPIRWSSFV